MFLLKFRKIFFYFVTSLVLVLLYFNLNNWQSVWLNRFLFLTFLILNTYLWQAILSKLLGLKRRDWITKLYAFFCVFLVLSFTSSVGVVWYKISPTIVWLIYFASIALAVFIREISFRSSVFRVVDSTGWADTAAPRQNYLFNKPIFLPLVFLMVWLVDLFLLSRGASTGVLNSPWQALNNYYIVGFFVLTLLLYLLVFSRHKVKFILFLLILHSLLSHLYLPAAHIMPWGGDVWRHLAIENKLLSGEEHLPVLFGPEARWREVAGIDAPEALIIPHKYIYGQLWGISVLLSGSLFINLLPINIWLMPLLWGVIMPLLLFRIGRILFGSWRGGLVLSALASIAFPFQALGALTLPVSLGYLTFSFVLMLWLQYLRDENKGQRNLAYFFAVLMIFGYTLHFILIWLIIIASQLVKYFSKKAIVNKFIFYLLKSIGILALILFIPVVELVSRSSQIPNEFNLFLNLKQMLGQLSGWYFAAAIRPHDILSGNIIFNHTPAWAYVPNFFLAWRWHIVGAMLAIWGLAGFGFFGGRKIAPAMEWKVMKFFGITVLSGYLIGWFVLSGDRSFVRRLDAAVAFVLIIFLLLGFYNLLRKKILKRLIKPLIVIFCILFSYLSASVYASGPDMRVISQDEFESANYIWERTDKKKERHCVASDTWELLALEGLSGRKIVGGGFPIDYQFAQPELARLYGKLQFEADQNVLSEMRELTGADKCFVVLPAGILDTQKERYLTEMMGSDGKAIGDLVIWEEMSTSTEDLTKINL